MAYSIVANQPEVILQSNQKKRIPVIDYPNTSIYLNENIGVGVTGIIPNSIVSNYAIVIPNYNRNTAIPPQSTFQYIIKPKIMYQKVPLTSAETFPNSDNRSF